MGHSIRDIGRLICLCRRRAGLTQRELASQAGLSAGYLGSVENGRKALSVEPLLLIAKALGVEPFELMPGQAEVKRRRAEVEGQVMERLRALVGVGRGRGCTVAAIAPVSVGGATCGGCALRASRKGAGDAEQRQAIYTL